MRTIKYLCLLLLVMMSVACNGEAGKATPTPDNNEIVTTITPEPTAAPTETPRPTEAPQPTEVPEKDPNSFFDPEAEENNNPNPYISLDGFKNEAGTVFELTEEEAKIYDEFKESLDINIFKEVDPVSIAKIFIQCGIEGAWQAEFGMFSERELTVTKTQYQEGHVVDILSTDIASRKEMADIVFAYLKDGEFTETEEGLGEIKFLDFVGAENIFRLAKNSDGIWLVKYGPFDEWTGAEQ